MSCSPAASSGFEQERQLYKANQNLVNAALNDYGHAKLPTFGIPMFQGLSRPPPE